MARLAVPPSFSRALRIPSVKPVAGSRIPRRVPYQSVASTKAPKSASPGVVRLPLKTFPSRIAVSKATAALLRSRLARNVPAATLKGLGACHRALLSINDRKVQTTDNAQDARRRGTHIPRPFPPAIGKGTKSPKRRVYRTTVRWGQVQDLVEKLKLRTEAATEAEVEEAECDDSMSFASDNNPDLLHDNSFDEDINHTADPMSQLSILSRMVSSTKAISRQARIAHAPVYLGDGLSRPRNRGRNVRTSSSMWRRKAEWLDDATPLEFTWPSKEASRDATDAPCDEHSEDESTVIVLPATKLQLTELPAIELPAIELLAIDPAVSNLTGTPVSSNQPTKVAVPSKAIGKSKAIATKVGSKLSRARSAKAPSKTLPPTKAKTDKLKPDSLSGSSKQKSSVLKKASIVAKSPEGAAAAQAKVRKAVQFLDGPIKPRFYDRTEPVKTKSLSSQPIVKHTWVALKGTLPCRGTPKARGFGTIFRAAGPRTVAVRPKVLMRFKSVQEYEKRRREEALARDEHPSLGQLEYGNADFKIALQVTGVITEDDIGVAKPLAELSGCLVGLQPRTMLWFGGFQDPLGRAFAKANVPCKLAEAYKDPTGCADRF